MCKWIKNDVYIIYRAWVTLLCLKFKLMKERNDVSIKRSKYTCVEGMLKQDVHICRGFSSTSHSCMFICSFKERELLHMFICVSVQICFIPSPLGNRNIFRNYITSSSSVCCQALICTQDCRANILMLISLNFFFVFLKFCVRILKWWTKYSNISIFIATTFNR